MVSVKMSILCFLLMFLLIVDNHATVIFSPAPQPQPPGTFPIMVQLLAVFILRSVGPGARVDAQKQRSRSRVCSSVRNAVQNVCVCLQAPMATNNFALVTITGRLRGVDQSALDFYVCVFLLFSLIMSFYLYDHVWLLTITL
ncbi:hypothetical protein CASFOL_025517 [Castilleja foliolosa]|uniref:Uncharacterized protein n=1 Tax=Castilleja foliolosa TaxID=1961234 RepID=A0ABD3CRC0_9LAMI